MNLPNFERFVELFGGQMVAALNASGSKTLTGKANGQTVRGLPNMVLRAHINGGEEKFYLQGMVCRLNGWDDIALSTSAPEGELLNKHGEIPFDWKGEEGSDARCDAMREFCRKVCVATDPASSRHFEEAPKVVPAKKSKAPSVNALAALGL